MQRYIEAHVMTEDEIEGKVQEKRQQEIVSHTFNDLFSICCVLNYFSIFYRHIIFFNQQSITDSIGFCRVIEMMSNSVSIL